MTELHSNSKSSSDTVPMISADLHETVFIILCLKAGFIVLPVYQAILKGVAITHLSLLLSAP